MEFSFSAPLSYFQISDACEDLIVSLVAKQRQRLGTLSKLKEHAFFKDRVDWKRLRHHPPFVPAVLKSFQKS